MKQKQCINSEEAELNVHPNHLISSKIHVNISFFNNAKTLNNLSHLTY